jgi:hypothetical protein
VRPVSKPGNLWASMEKPGECLVKRSDESVSREDNRSGVAGDDFELNQSADDNLKGCEILAGGRAERRPPEARRGEIAPREGCQQRAIAASIPMDSGQ